MGVKSLAVFGSTARGEAKPGSDVDLLVTFRDPPTFDQFIQTKFYLEDLLGCKVDLALRDSLKPLIRARNDAFPATIGLFHLRSGYRAGMIANISGFEKKKLVLDRV